MFLNKIFFSLVLGTSVIFTLIPHKSHSFPQAPFDALEVDSDQIKMFDLGADTQANSNYDFNGIVKLSNCSGSLIKFSGQPENSQAFVLTNGHCVGNGFPQPGEAIYKKNLTRKMKVSDTKENYIPVTATQLVYATMTGTDSALYLLKETYADLKKKGVDPLELSGMQSEVGTPIDIPSGYWERGYSCAIKYFVYELKEDDWSFYNSIRYTDTGCDVIGGTSGSPIVEQGTRYVVGVNNTGNESGFKCTMNNPCEIDQNKNVSVHRGASYGQQTYSFYSCLSVDFKIDLSLPNCELTK